MNRRQRRQQRLGIFACSVFSVYSVSSNSKGSAMHSLFAQASNWTHVVIGAAIEARKDKGLIINFNELMLTGGVSRLILPGANLA